MVDLKYCTNCLFPKTKPDLEFDKNRICSACISCKLRA